MNHIAIIGGGPGGLMLGLLLQQRGYNFTIFEKSDGQNHQSQGGSLDIHGDTGQIPLKEAGLIDAFNKLARFEGEDTKIVDSTGQIYYEDYGDGEGERPEIDRGELCDLIRSHINTTSIKYGYEFESLEQLANGNCEVAFSNGYREQFDYVIGSDGAFSKVRSYLVDVDVEYTGISMVEINVEDVKQQHPNLLEYNKNGKMMALEADKGLLAQLNGDDKIKVYVSYRMAEAELDDYKQLSQEALRNQLLSDFEQWDEELLNYIRHMSNEVLFRRIYRLPIGFNWETNQSITLIGDAAHLMSPFAGEGVNMALYDAYLFVKALDEYTDDMTITKKYEQAMNEVSSNSAQASQENLERMFSEDAAKKLGDMFTSMD
ncbi:FAD-dependent monooxygenase [Staphylococcus gallinarum]|uniref:FAD-dependent monooxygenase n=1 Tax=Staphylococcus gallinarum TaxID=1293 RepID=A0A3A0VNJ3_STAGA|nr:NAD(P)/FAD-dependent oxidoreductase [Staphylococcus gallinarum]RIP37043.1 FAD-dependent monooxygenase [Staphylococcus gallinarum]